jgi:hypothetical protein
MSATKSIVPGRVSSDPAWLIVTSWLSPPLPITVIEAVISGGGATAGRSVDCGDRTGPTDGDRCSVVRRLEHDLHVGETGGVARDDRSCGPRHQTHQESRGHEAGR